MDTYDYVINKPELNEDTLMHYGIKGMKWKNHIYSLKNKAVANYGNAKNKVLTMLPILNNNLKTVGKKTKGKYYRAKSKMAELNAQSARLHTGVKDTDTTQKTRTIRTGYYNKWEAHGIKSGTNGKANSHSGQVGSRVNQGIAAGRERVAKKKKKK